MATVLNAILDIIHASQNKKLFEASTRTYGIRINNFGAYLEDFVAAAFSNSLMVDDPAKRQELKEKTFCFEGSQNFSPDLMLKNSGPAIETKKLQSRTAGYLALNSSPPRQTLKVDDLRIAPGARTAEKWKERKMIYAIGVVSDNVVNALQLVYGDCFVARDEFYKKVGERVKDALQNSGVENLTTDSNELGRVTAVDPLKVTYLRIRGMWEIRDPIGIFGAQGIKEYSFTPGFTLLAMIRKGEFVELIEQNPPLLKELKKLALVQDVKILNPDNTAQRIDAVLIKYAAVPV